MVKMEGPVHAQRLAFFLQQVVSGICYEQMKHKKITAVQLQNNSNHSPLQSVCKW